jgi:hypothetical protein
LAKVKSDKEDEDYKGRIRELEKENKALRRELKAVLKYQRVQEGLKEDAEEPTYQPIKAEPSCPSCKTGTIVLTDLGVRNLWSCSSCLWRKIYLK